MTLTNISHVAGKVRLDLGTGLELLTPGEARRVANDLATRASEAELYEPELPDTTPGALYFDQDRNVYVVGNERVGRPGQVRLWRLRSEHEGQYRGSTSGSLRYWQVREGREFTRVRTNGGAPLGGEGRL